MIRGILTIALCACLIFDNKLYAQCGVSCEDFTLTIPDCDVLTDLENLIGLGGDCNYIIYNEAGQRVPNPIPADPRYLCQNLSVYSFNGEDTCKSNFFLGISTIPEIYPEEFRSISIRNYEADRIPRPRVEGCSVQPPYRILVADDEILGICNVIPKVVRKWTVIDRCGNKASATQTFDLVGDISCQILGPNRVPVGSSIDIKSQFTPKGFKPFNTSWQVINGEGWSIQSNKLDPTKAVLTPGPIPGQATVVMDVFDRLGCSRRCEKIFTSYISKGGFNPRGAVVPEFELTVLYDELQLRFSTDLQVDAVRVLDISGKRVAGVELTGEAGQLSLPLSGLIPGIYIVQCFTGNSVETKTFYKF